MDITLDDMARAVINKYENVPMEIDYFFTSRFNDKDNTIYINPNELYVYTRKKKNPVRIFMKCCGADPENYTHMVHYCVLHEIGHMVHMTITPRWLWNLMCTWHEQSKGKRKYYRTPQELYANAFAIIHFPSVISGDFRRINKIIRRLSNDS